MFSKDPQLSSESKGIPPILLIGFNRPDHMRKQIDNIRLVRPEKVFVNIDGPREGVLEDVGLRDQVIACLDTIDWPCSVERRIESVNRGMNVSVTGAIDWFFDAVDRGIILEDDCIARPEFFDFAAELLDRFADDERIMHISGLSMISDPDAATSYVFAPVGHIWGWATWRRAWQLNDPSMSKWPEVRDSVRRRGALGRALTRKFDSSAAQRKVRWARWWYLANVANNGLAIVPTVNLVSNIGVGPGATNTVTGYHPLVLESDVPMTFPLRHPDNCRIDRTYERLLAKYHARSFKDRTVDRLEGLIRNVRRQRRRSGVAR